MGLRFAVNNRQIWFEEASSYVPDLAENCIMNIGRSSEVL
jgi:hypothetical protein